MFIAIQPTLNIGILEFACLSNKQVTNINFFLVLIFEVLKSITHKLYKIKINMIF